MTRIMMISKFKKIQGGVERHLSDLTAGLRARGHDVCLFSSEDIEAAGGSVFSATSSGFKRASSATSLLWNAEGRNLLAEAIHSYHPELLHYHSIYHQLSPSILGVSDVPSIMTLHDYKLSAPCYTLYRDGEICQECVGAKFALAAVKYRCVSNSVGASLLCATEDLMHRSRYRKHVDRFIVPSEFAFNVAVRGGLHPDHVAVIPWGVSNTRDGMDRSHHHPKVAFFGGRLHRTKGIEIILRAWSSLPKGHGCVLRIAGEGELEPWVRQASSDDPTIQYLGMLEGSSVASEVSRASLVLVPSLFPETMGLSALEALVAGTPLVISNRGALADLQGPGVWMLPQTDRESVLAALRTLLLEGASEQYRRELRRRDLSVYTQERMLDAIEGEYHNILTAGQTT